MFRKKLSLQVEPIEKDVFSPNKEEDKKEFKSHIQKPKRKLKEQSSKSLNLKY
jgi:hypothetical protein